MLIFDSSSIVLNLMDYSNVFLKSSIKVDFVKKKLLSLYHTLYRTSDQLIKKFNRLITDYQYNQY